MMSGIKEKKPKKAAFVQKYSKNVIDKQLSVVYYKQAFEMSAAKQSEMLRKNFLKKFLTSTKHCDIMNKLVTEHGT